MLLPNMTYKEAFEEINKDYEDIQKGEQKICQQFTRFLLKTTRRFPILQRYTYTTPVRKNKLCFICTSSKRNIDAQSGISIYIIWDNAYGKNVIWMNKLVHDRRNGRYGLIVVMTSHLFSRYRERFLKDQDMTNEEVINHFMERNCQMVGTDISNELLPGSMELEDRSKLKIAYVSQQGVSFGVVVETEVVLMKTFVSYDMLYPNQEAILLPMRDKLMEMVPPALRV